MRENCFPARPQRSATRHEHDRLESLRSYRLLDTPAEDVYDHAALMAARACAAPMAAIALVDADRVWFKARVGIHRTQVPRTGTFCTEVVSRQGQLAVADSRKSPDFATAAADGVLAYAGVPLVGRDGLPLGTLCVFDVEPRRFPDTSLQWLTLLAEQVVAQMELRRVDRRAGLTSPESTEMCQTGGMRGALDRGELRPWFQPIVDVATGERCGAEALLRWDHPERGVVGPAAFLPLLEATGLMLPTGRQVARLALAALSESYAAGTSAPPSGISINASPVELVDGFAGTLLDQVEAAGLPPEVVTVELTETGTTESMDTIRRELRRLRDAGLQVEADDFGSGQSTLQRLLDLPLTGIKLDLGIIRRVPGDARVASVVRWLVAGAHDLGLGVVAEGVETEAQLDFLRDIGCDRAQGYLFGRPRPRLGD